MEPQKEKWREEFDKRFIYKQMEDGRYAIYCFAHDAPASDGEMMSFIADQIAQAERRGLEAARELINNFDIAGSNDELLQEVDALINNLTNGKSKN